MTSDHQPAPHFYSPLEESGSTTRDRETLGELCTLMRELLAAQDRQNELLEELVDQVGAHQRQRAADLGLWQQANPELANFCRRAADKLGAIQNDYLTSITEEIEYGFESLRDGDYVLTEFVDRFGPRFAHLNGLLHVLAQLGNPSNVAEQHADSRSIR